MSIGAITNNSNIWGTGGYAAQAAAFGRQDGPSGFEEALKSSMGFGSRAESGEVVGSIAATASNTGDLLSQLQFSMLKNNDHNGLNGRLSNALF